MTETEKLNILLVDDRPENLRALEIQLENSYINIIKATSGNEALGLVLKYDFALILLDVQMPDMDGFETAELMKGDESTKCIPIIFVTAICNEREHLLRGYDVGGADFIFKPLDPEILKCKVRVFLELHQQKNAQQEKELQSTASLSRLSGSAKDQMLGMPPLKRGGPDEFNEFVKRYGNLLDLSFEQRVSKASHNISEELGAISEELGFMKATPRDVVEIHSTALREKSDKGTQGTIQIYVEEGRIMLLELMGNLVSFYRKYTSNKSKPTARKQQIKGLKFEDLGIKGLRIVD